MSRLLDLIAGRPGLVLTLVGLLTLAAAEGIFDLRTGAWRLAFDPSTAGLVAEGNEVQEFYDRTRRTFGNDQSVLVVLAGIDVFSREGLERVTRLTRRLQQLPRVQRVLSLSTATHIRGSQGDVEIGPFFEEPPGDPDELDRVRDEVMSNPFFRGSLVSRDERAAAIVVYFEGLSDREFLESGLDGRIRATADAEARGAEVWVTGRLRWSAAMHESALGVYSVATPLMFLFAGLVLLLAFRSATGVLVPLLTIAVAVTWTMGVMGWLGRSVNIVTAIVPPLVITVSFSYAMHVIAEYYELRARPGRQGGEASAVRGALRGVGMPVLVTGLTTGIGLLALATSRLPAIREFGLFSVLGVACGVVASLTFAPAALQLRERRRSAPARIRRSPSRLARVAARMADFDYRRRREIFVFGGAVLVLAVAGMFRIQVGRSFVADFDPDARIRADHESIDAAFAGADPFLIVVESNARDSLSEPANMEAVRALQEWLEAQPEIGDTTSYVDYLMLLNRALHGEDPAWFRVPESQRLAMQLLFFGAGEELDRLVDSRFTTAVVNVRASANDSLSSARLLRRIEERLAGLPGQLSARPTGDTVVLNSTFDDIARGQLRSILLALAVIYLVLAAMFTSFRVGLTALIPNVLPIFIFFGTLGLTGIPLDTATSLIACIALGIAVDDTIHYFWRFNVDARAKADEREATVSALLSVVRPVSFTTLGLVLCFLALTTAEMNSWVQFGSLSALTLGAAWLVDVTLTPALCSQIRIVTLWDVLSLDLGKEPQRSIPLLSGLTLRQARIVALMFSIQEVKAGDRVFAEHAEGEEMWVILEGELQASVEREGGRIVLGSMTRGDALGEIGLFAGKRSADVDAVRDSRLLRLTNDDLDGLRERYPRVAARVFQNLSLILAHRLERTTAKVR